VVHPGVRGDARAGRRPPAAHPAARVSPPLCAGDAFPRASDAQGAHDLAHRRASS
jgi:hypothetical protein